MPQGWLADPECGGRKKAGASEMSLIISVFLSLLYDSVAC